MQASLILWLAILVSVTEQLHRQRRRGEELEAALLDAAWDELVKAGFARLTMESVAARAKTGVAVLYRRWPNKDDLVLAAIAAYGLAHPVEKANTGSLHGDMLALLNAINDRRSSFTAVVIAAFSGLQASTGLTPRRCVTGSSPTTRRGLKRSSIGRTNAANSISAWCPPRCCRCRST
jgi:AcrR family transcriptional regulator